MFIDLICWNLQTYDSTVTSCVYKKLNIICEPQSVEYLYVTYSDVDNCTLTKSVCI